MEAAVLEPRADSMRDMVRMHLQQRQFEDDDGPDEEFLDDDTFEVYAELAEAPLSDEQLLEMAREHEYVLRTLGEHPDSSSPSEPEGSETDSAEPSDSSAASADGP